MSRSLALALALSLTIIVVLSVMIAIAIGYHAGNDPDRAAWRAAHHCKQMPHTIEESPQTRYLCDGGEVVTQ